MHFAFHCYFIHCTNSLLFHFLFWVLLLYSRLALVNDVLYSFLPQSQFIHLSIYMIIAIYRKFSSYRLVMKRTETGTERSRVWLQKKYSRAIRCHKNTFFYIFGLHYGSYKNANFWLLTPTNNHFLMIWCITSQVITNIVSIGTLTKKEDIK